MAGGLGRALSAALVALPGVLAGQGFTLAGQLRHGGRDGRPLAGRTVVLHRVTQQGGAALDSLRTGAGGWFTFHIAAVDTTALYLVSTAWDGIGYFSSPARLLGRPRDTLPALVVYDTASTGAAPRLLRRLISLARLGESGDGSWDVLEALQIENQSTTTRVAVDTLHPTWTSALPAGAIQFQAADGDVSPDAIARRGDTVSVYGAIAPGAIRQITVTYRMPADQRAVTIPIDQPTGGLELLIEGEGADVSGPAPGAIALAGVEELEGRRFAHYRSAALPAGARVLVTLPAGRRGVQDYVPVIAGGLAVVLAGGLWFAFRRPRVVAGARPGR